jgi:hypothetical protein
MNLDLRLPMGGMFTLVGLILTVKGMLSWGSDIYDRALGVNLNFYWGLVLLAFGLVMFVLGRRGQKKALSAPPEEIPEDEVRRGHGH